MSPLRHAEIHITTQWTTVCEQVLWNKILFLGINKNAAKACHQNRVVWRAQLSISRKTRSISNWSPMRLGYIWSTATVWKWYTQDHSNDYITIQHGSLVRVTVVDKIWHSRRNSWGHGLGRTSDDHTAMASKRNKRAKADHVTKLYCNTNAIKERAASEEWVPTPKSM